MAVSFQPLHEQHIDNRKILRTMIPVENADKVGQIRSEATGRSRPKAEVPDRPLLEGGVYADPHKNL